MMAASGQAGPRLLSCSVGYPIKPVAKQLGSTKSGPAAYENHKRRLERVLGILLMVQDPTTHAEHHRTVAANQLGKRLRILAAGKVLEQVTVTFLSFRAGAQRLPWQLQLACGHIPHVQRTPGNSEPGPTLRLPEMARR
jgi:hypothetical protein